MKWTLATDPCSSRVSAGRCVVHGRSLLAAQAPPHLGGQLAEQGLLVLEVPVEEALGDTCGVDDVDDPRVGA